ncbi:MAG TPA: DUF2492 family protein [Phycisphaerales bacterium]|nr:DUF2492 family protein [Phycisphaerales bacterium]
MSDHHAHEVMQMMADSGADYTRETFKAALVDRFGSDATFCSCSRAGMTADELLAFLSGRGKLAGDIDGTFRLGVAGHCGHGH